MPLWTEIYETSKHWYAHQTVLTFPSRVVRHALFCSWVKPEIVQKNVKLEIRAIPPKISDDFVISPKKR